MIRPMQAEDEKIYFELSKQMYDSDVVLFDVNENNFKKTFNLIISDSPFVAGHILEHQGEKAGYGIVSLSYSNEAGGMVLWLEELYILSQFRSLGLGSEYFEFIYEKYDKEAAIIRLEVTDTNTRAIELYKRKGFDTLKYVQMFKRFSK